MRRARRNVNSALSSWQKQETKATSEEKEVLFLDVRVIAIFRGLSPETENYVGFWFFGFLFVLK